MKLLAPIKNDEDIVNKKYVDSIDIGSRNIVTGTDTMTIGSINQATWENKQWRQSGTGTIETIDITETLIPSVNKGIKLTASSTEQIGICQNLIPLNNNNIYTLSCWVRGSSSGLTCRLQPFYASSTDTGGIKSFTLTGEWQYISYTANKTPQNTTNYNGAYIYLIPTAAGDTLEVCGIKLERGNKATDWSPAPEDLSIVSIDAENPSENTNTYVSFCKGVSNGSNLLINNGIRYYTREGTKESDGFGELIVGNNINSGTASNKWGSLRLYGHGTTYEAIRPYEQSEDLIKYLVGSNSATSIGNEDTPVYIDNKGIVTSTGKKFSDYLPLTGTAIAANKVNNSLTINGESFDGSAKKNIDLLPFVIGTQTAATESWTGTASTISSLFDGLTIRYWLPYAGSGNATLNLTLADGTSSGAIPCYYGGTSRLTTHYGAGNIVTLTYRENVTIGSTTIENGWWADANTLNTAGSTNTSSKIFLIGATSQVSSSTTYSHKNVYANSDNGLYLDNDSKVNSYFISKQKYTDSITHQINFGISSNGIKGIYDSNDKKWLIYATQSDRDTEPNKIISYGALEVVTGTIDKETGTTEPIKKPYGRNRVMIEGWIDGYSGFSYQGLADSMTAVNERTIVNANSKTMTYSISTDGTITISGYGQYRLIYHTL